MMGSKVMLMLTVSIHFDLIQAYLLILCLKTNDSDGYWVRTARVYCAGTGAAV